MKPLVALEPPLNSLGGTLYVCGSEILEGLTRIRDNNGGVGHSSPAPRTCTNLSIRNPGWMLETTNPTANFRDEHIYAGNFPSRMFQGSHV